MKTTTNSLGDTTWTMEKPVPTGVAVIEFARRGETVEVVRYVRASDNELAISGIARRHGEAGAMRLTEARLAWSEARTAGYR